MKRHHWIIFVIVALLTIAGALTAIQSSRARRLQPLLPDLERDYAAQIECLDGYAREFSSFILGRQLFPKRENEEREKELFKAPAILEVRVGNEHGAGLSAAHWSNNNKVYQTWRTTFWHPIIESSSGLTSLEVSHGSTRLSPDTMVAKYRKKSSDVRTGEIIWIEITFDLTQVPQQPR